MVFFEAKGIGSDYLRKRVDALHPNVHAMAWDDQVIEKANSFEIWRVAWYSILSRSQTIWSQNSTIYIFCGHHHQHHHHHHHHHHQHSGKIIIVSPGLWPHTFWLRLGGPFRLFVYRFEWISGAFRVLNSKVRYLSWWWHHKIRFLCW